MCIGFGGGFQSTHCGRVIVLLRQCHCGFVLGVCVYMGGGVDTPGDEASHPLAARPPQGLFIPFEWPVFHWEDRRLKPCLSQSLNS